MEWTIHLGFFLAATIIPLSSEAILSAFLLLKFDSLTCLFVASLGNWFGGITTYYLGWIAQKKIKSSLSKTTNSRSLKIVNRCGMYSAFFCWLPFIGDAIAFLLGYVKAKAFPVFLLMLSGKFFRYLLLIYFYKNL